MQEVYLKIPAYPFESTQGSNLQDPHIVRVPAAYKEDQTPTLEVWRNDHVVGTLQKGKVEVIHVGGHKLTKVSGYLGETYLEGGLEWPFSETEVLPDDPETLKSERSYILQVSISPISHYTSQALHQALVQKLNSLASTLIANYPMSGVLVVNVDLEGETLSQEQLHAIGADFYQSFVALCLAKPTLPIHLLYRGEIEVLEQAFAQAEGDFAVPIFDGKHQVLGTLTTTQKQALMDAYHGQPILGESQEALLEIRQEFPWLIRKRYEEKDGRVNRHYEPMLALQELRVLGLA